MHRIVTLLAGAALLGGCQALFGDRAKLEVRPIGGEVTAENAAVALEDGRARLREGQVGYAIVSLRLAATNPAFAAEAHNGLGVAYARLGRGDLAERYFREAMAEAPQDPRFAANLARYYQSRDAALARASSAPLGQVFAAEATVVAPDPQMPQPKHLSGAAAAEMIQRVSAREVVVRTAAATPAPVITVGQRPLQPRAVAAVAVAAPAHAATPTAAHVAKPAAVRTAPPVAVASTGPARASRQIPVVQAEQAYPIRITLEGNSRHSRSVIGPAARTAAPVAVARSGARANTIRVPITGTVASR